jgi:hypothetical protein
MGATGPQTGTARRLLRGCLVLCALALGCGDALSGVPGADRAAAPIGEAAAPIDDAAAPIDEVVSAAAESSELPEIELTPESDAELQSAGSAEPSEFPRASVATERPPAPAPASAEIHVPLESLLSTPLGPRAFERPVDLAARDAASFEPAVAVPPGALDGWKQRVQLERRVEPIGRPGPRQGTHSEIDAALRIPIDESVSVKGGVRVDERDDAGDEPQRRSTPRVGVEVRF